MFWDALLHDLLLSCRYLYLFIASLIKHVSINSILKLYWFRLFHRKSFDNYFGVCLNHSTFFSDFNFGLRHHVISKSLRKYIFISRRRNKSLWNLVISSKKCLKQWIIWSLRCLWCINIDELYFINFFRSCLLILFSRNLKLFTSC